MNKKCDNCKLKCVCIDYECWIGLGYEEPNANECKHYVEEKNDNVEM